MSNRVFGSYSNRILSDPEIINITKDPLIFQNNDKSNNNEKYKELVKNIVLYSPVLDAKDQSLSPDKKDKLDFFDKITNNNDINSSIINKHEKDINLCLYNFYKQLLNKNKLPENDMRFFLKNPFTKDQTFQCNLLITNKNFSLYSNVGDIFIINALRTTVKFSSKFIISKDLEQYQSSSVLGYLRSNFMGTEFNIYDEGRNPKEKINKIETKELRCHLGQITYESNLMRKTPRKMKVYLPRIDSQTHSQNIIKPEVKNFKLADLAQKNSYNIQTFIHKQPIWDVSKFYF